jgi:hypothetical protein
MKTIYALVYLVLFSALLQARYNPVFEDNISLNKTNRLSRQMSTNRIDRYSDSVVSPNKTSPQRTIDTSLTDTIKYNRYVDKINRYHNSTANPHKTSNIDTVHTSMTDTINTSLTDTMKYNMYGDLLNDNPLYNERSPWWMVVLRVTLANVTTNLVDRFIFNYDYSRIGFNSWKHNMQTGWEWDNDRFAMNNFFHPFSGGMSFNAARANGYSFFESVPFAALGSLEWEYFGETTLPSYNDIINTTINGAFLGEIFYRLGSNILDDQTTGADRFIREFAVAIMTPTRFFSRLVQGKLTRLTTEEVYQKEPLNITLEAGYHRGNEGTNFKIGTTNSLNMDLNLDYGNPFEKRSRKPYDYYKVRADIDFGVGRKIIDNVIGYGILTGENLQVGSTEMLVGLFQHMNYFDNNTFELATIAFGPGMVSKWPITKSTSLYTDLHVSAVPFGSLSGRFVTDTSEYRDYNYGGGAQLEFESTFNIGGWVGLTLAGYYWWFHTFVGTAGNSYVAIVKPRITFKLYKSVSIGFEQLIYYADRYPTNLASVHDVRTEQKVFFQIFIEEFKFKK